MAKNDGRNNFMRVIEQLSRKGSDQSTVVAELGTMQDGGVLPDSYPSGSEADDDFMVLSNADINDGDRVLLIWTDTDDIVVLGKVEGGEEDAG